MWRGILAVLAGYLVVALLTLTVFALIFPEETRRAMEGKEVDPPGFGMTPGLLGVGMLTGLIGGAVAGIVGGQGARNGRAPGLLMSLMGGGLNGHELGEAAVLVPARPDRHRNALRLRGRGDRGATSTG